MHFKTLFIALGLIAAATAAALPEPELETRAVSAPFKIRRFTPLGNFDASIAGTWADNQYTNVATANAFFNYDGVTVDKAFGWTFDPAAGLLRGSLSGSGGLAPRNLQSYGVTVTPVIFGGAGEVVKVTIGPAPLNEVKFQTVRNGAPVAGWTAFTQVDGNIFLGKAADIATPLRFRAVGYVAPV